MSNLMAPALGLLRSGKRPLNLGTKFRLVCLLVLLIAAGNVIYLNSVLNRVDGVAETVNIAGKLRFHTDSRDLDSTELKFDIKDKCDWRLVPVLADLRRFSRPFIHSVTEPDGTVFEMETGPGTEGWTPIEAMSP